jgi:hemin uptake protein HemP
MDRSSNGPHDDRQQMAVQPASPLQSHRAPLPSEQLLQGRRLVEIAHNGEVYRLQATRLGKLILTK